MERTLIRQIFDAAPRDAINLGLGEPDLPTPDAICEGGLRAIEERRTGYTTTAGDPELRRAVADRYPDAAGGPENVLITVGSQQALFTACLTLVEPGTEVLYPDPGYPAYPTVVRLVGADPVPYRLAADRGFQLDAEAVEQALSPRTSLAILCAPSNPTGACHPPEALRSVVDLLAARGIPWLSDEVYAALTFEQPALSPSSLAPAGGLVVSSLSKEASMTGWRVGWLVGPEQAIARATAVHQHQVTCSPGISQRAALAAFGDEGRRAIAEWRERLRQRRELMGEALSHLPGVGFRRPEGGFYYFVDVSAHGHSLEIARRILERHKVVTIPGEAFGEHGAGYLRLSFAADEREIVEGVRRVGLGL
jgi:aspartate/methionine/tyrosine aminotransferase